MGVFVVILFILLAILAALTLGLFLPLRFRFWGVVAPGDIRYRASIKLPLVPWYIRLPDITRKRPKGDRAEDTARDVHSRLDSVRRALATFKSYYPEVVKTASHMARAVRVEQFRVLAKVGTGDAYDTALLAGGISAAAGVVLSIAQKKGIQFTERPRVRIVPVYDRVYASAEVRIAASITPWRGILAAWRLYRQVRRIRRVTATGVSNPRGWNTRA